MPLWNHTSIANSATSERARVSSAAILPCSHALERCSLLNMCVTRGFFIHLASSVARPKRASQGRFQIETFAAGRASSGLSSTSKVRYLVEHHIGTLVPVPFLGPRDRL